MSASPPPWLVASDGVGFVAAPLSCWDPSLGPQVVSMTRVPQLVGRRDAWIRDWLGRTRGCPGPEGGVCPPGPGLPVRVFGVVKRG